MGRNKFGPQRGPWRDHEWRGWWGDEPPFHTPVLVMTHHERPSFSTLHVVVAPVQLGSGVRLWHSPDQLLDQFHLEVVPSPSGVVHHLFWRR